ncbi:hypothetical protein EU523_01070, partial [Candidatus Heimdallarchaeota archaeon]
MKFKQLFKISKIVYQESYLQGQLNQMGSNKARYLENLSKKRNFNSQSLFSKIFTGIYNLVLFTLPFQAFKALDSAIEESVSLSWGIFSIGVIISLFFLFQFTILFIFNLIFSSGLMMGESFRLLGTLPIRQKDLEKIAFFTFFRGIDIQFITSVLVFPLGVAVGTRSVLLTIIAFLIALVNGVFFLSFLVLIGKKFAQLMEKYEVNDTKANVIRIFFMIAYIIGSFFIYSIIQWATQTIFGVFNNQIFTEQTLDILNPILSFIPFPFSISFLIPFIYLKQSIPILMWVGTSVGAAIYIGLTILVLRKALSALNDVAYSEVEVYQEKEEKEITIEEVVFETRKPTMALIKKDLFMATRDISTMSLFLTPILFPLFSLIFQFTTDSSMGNFISGTSGMLASNLIFYVMGGMMLINGSSKLEQSGTTINASLPIAVRDQVKAKLIYFITILPLSTIIPQIFRITDLSPT